MSWGTDFSIWPGPQLESQFILRLLDGAKVRDLCGQSTSLTPNWENSFYGPGFVHCHVETEKARPQTVARKL